MNEQINEAEEDKFIRQDLRAEEMGLLSSLFFSFSPEKIHFGDLAAVICTELSRELHKKGRKCAALFPHHRHAVSHSALDHGKMPELHQSLRCLVLKNSPH